MFLAYCPFTDETVPFPRMDSDGKCGFGGRDVACNVSTTASIRVIRVIRGSCPDFTIRVRMNMMEWQKMLKISSCTNQNS
jgi:hypothetical protein